jgi:hypothetical protein
MLVQMEEKFCETAFRWLLFSTSSVLYGDAREWADAMLAEKHMVDLGAGADLC